jgi:hypothetical protein
MDRQPAINPGWKISIIPKNAGNATDPVFASTQEVESVIANPGSLAAPQPVESTSTAVEVAPRYNANVPYNPEPVIYSMNDQIVMQAIRVAVANGWTEYHRFANSAVTIGMEAEAVIEGMKKRGASIAELFHSLEFLNKLWPNDYEKQTRFLASADPIKFLEANT